MQLMKEVLGVNTSTRITKWKSAHHRVSKNDIWIDDYANLDLYFNNKDYFQQNSMQNLLK